MNRQETIEALRTAKWALCDLGQVDAADIAEQAEINLDHFKMTPEVARKLADYILPRGKRGRIKLVLGPPQYARAIAFIAAVLRSFEDE